MGNIDFVPELRETSTQTHRIGNLGRDFSGFEARCCREEGEVYLKRGAAGGVQVLNRRREGCFFA